MDNIGKVLRQARIDQGMTIDDLQKKTRIQKRYLIAIENGDFDQLPGQFYVRAFIKQYGENVGVDTDSYFKTTKETEVFGGQSKQPVEDAPSGSQSEPEPEPASASPYLSRRQPESRWHSLIPQVLVIAAVVLVVFVVWFFYQRANPRTPQVTEKGQVSSVKSTQMQSSDKSKTKTSSKVQSSSSSKSSQSSKTSSQKPTQSVALKTQSGSNYTYAVNGLKTTGNKLTLSATNGDSWDKVVVDGSTLYSGILTAGQSTAVNLPDNARSITITFGATANSKLVINEETVDFSAINTPGVSNLNFNIEKN